MSSDSLWMSTDEMIAYLKRSSLPTLLVEGSGDKSLLRRIECELKSRDISIQPVGGKGSIDTIFSKKEEIGRKDVVFLRDRDDWVIFGAPERAEEIILTTGYSIENDVLDYAVICKLANPNQSALDAAVDGVSTWFMHAMYGLKAGDSVDVSRDVSFIWDGVTHLPEAVADIKKYQPNADFKENFSGNRWIWLRGKTLLRTVHYCLSNGTPRYNKDQIVDLCIRLGPSHNFLDLVDRILSRFPSQEIDTP